LVFPVARAPAGEKAPLSPRYQSIEKTAHTRLVGVYGHPEVEAAAGHEVAFSHDGKLGLFAGGGPFFTPGARGDAVLSLWDVDKGVLLHEWKIPNASVTALDISPTNKVALVAWAGVDKKEIATTLVLWDLASGEKLKTLESQGEHLITGVAFSPEGKRALSGSQTGILTLWDLAPGKKKAVLAKRKTPVLSVGFLPNGHAFAGVQEGQILFWDSEGRLERELKGLSPLSLAASADGKTVAGLGFDRNVQVWNLATRKSRALRKDAQGNGLGTIALTADGKHCLAVENFLDNTGTVEDSSITLWDTASGKERWSHKARFKGTAPIHVHPDGKKAIVGGGANPFALYDLADGKLLRTWGGHKGAVNAVAIDARGNVFSAASDRTVKGWGPGGKELMTFTGHTGAINALALSADGAKIVTASTDKTLKLWDSDTGKDIRTFKGHDGNVTSLALSPGGRLLLSGSDDRTLKLWNLQTGRALKTLVGHAERVNAVAFSPDSSWVASASDDNTVRLWPLQNKEDLEVKVMEGHKRQVTCLAFSPDGKQLLSGSQDQTLKLWDVAEGKELRTFQGHKNWITSLAFPRPDLAASVADDLTIRLWNVNSGKEIDKVDLGPASDVARSVAFAPDASSFVAGTAGWVILRFEFKGGASGGR
jgi:WD40 repeat protein